MTKQLHPYVRNSEQQRKALKRTALSYCTCHTRNWWKAWHRRWKKENKEI